MGKKPYVSMTYDVLYRALSRYRGRKKLSRDFTLEEFRDMVRDDPKMPSGMTGGANLRRFFNYLRRLDMIEERSKDTYFVKPGPLERGLMQQMRGLGYEIDQEMIDVREKQLQAHRPPI